MPETNLCCEYDPPDERLVEQVASLASALADPRRVSILCLVTEKRCVCVCELELSLPLDQSTVSHHLKRLKAAGLITGESRGKWTYYSATPRARRLLRALQGEKEA